MLYIFSVPLQAKVPPVARSTRVPPVALLQPPYIQDTAPINVGLTMGYKMLLPYAAQPLRRLHDELIHGSMKHVR